MSIYGENSTLLYKLLWYNSAILKVLVLFYFKSITSPGLSYGGGYTLT